jgi:hypothetical protein
MRQRLCCIARGRCALSPRMRRLLKRLLATEFQSTQTACLREIIDKFNTQVIIALRAESKLTLAVHEPA